MNKSKFYYKCSIDSTYSKIAVLQVSCRSYRFKIPQQEDSLTQYWKSDYITFKSRVYIK